MSFYETQRDIKLIDALKDIAKAIRELSARDGVASVLERQIPMKPDYWGDGFDDDGNIVYDQAKCPVCGHDFEYQINEWGSKFCQDCGQALDWSDNE